MLEKRIERVYLQDNCLIVASSHLDEKRPQSFDLKAHNSTSKTFLALQINAMLDEAEKRGIKQGAEECLKRCLETIRDLARV